MLEYRDTKLFTISLFVIGISISKIHVNKTIESFKKLMLKYEGKNMFRNAHSDFVAWIIVLSS